MFINSSGIIENHSPIGNLFSKVKGKVVFYLNDTQFVSCQKCQAYKSQYFLSAPPGEAIFIFI